MQEKLSNVKKFVSENPAATLREVYGEFQSDLDSVLLASIYLNLDYHDLLKEESTKRLSEVDQVNRIELFIEDDFLFNKIIPRTVRTSFLILMYLDQYLPKSKEIVLEVKKDQNYISDILKENIFDRPIVFFSTQINLRDPAVIQVIENKIKSLDIVFVEPTFKLLFSHFDLVEYLSLDEESKVEFLAIIRDNIQDAIFPAMINQKAEISDNSVKIVFDNEFLATSIHYSKNEIDYKKLMNEFLKTLSEDVKDELIESTMKVAITQSWGFGLFDVSIKAVKAFFVALSKSGTRLSESAVKEDYVNFISSGSSSIKEWFLEEKSKEFKSAIEASGLGDIDVNPKIFEKYYDQFIVRYFILHGALFRGMQVPEDHTALFTFVCDEMFGQTSKTIRIEAM